MDIGACAAWLKASAMDSGAPTVWREALKESTWRQKHPVRDLCSRDRQPRTWTQRHLGSRSSWRGAQRHRADRRPGGRAPARAQGTRAAHAQHTRAPRGRPCPPPPCPRPGGRHAVHSSGCGQVRARPPPADRTFMMMMRMMMQMKMMIIMMTIAQITHALHNTRSTENRERALEREERGSPARAARSSWPQRADQHQHAAVLLLPRCFARASGGARERARRTCVRAQHLAQSTSEHQHAQHSSQHSVHIGSANTS